MVDIERIEERATEPVTESQEPASEQTLAAPVPTAKLAKNKAPGKAKSGVAYIFTGKWNTAGKIPQQQLDLAKILATFPKDKEVPESEVFEALEAFRDDYKSLRESKQDVTYLFRYYRGLKPQGKHAGFVARGFLRQVEVAQPVVATVVEAPAAEVPVAA